MISGTTVRNKSHGAEDSSGQDRMGGYTRWPEAYLVTLTGRCSFLCVSGQRGTIAKSMHEEHLCVVALTSMERGTQFFPLASYRRLCDRLLLFVYFQVNNGVVYLDYEDSHHHGPLLCSFQLLYWICLYCLMMYCFVFPFVGVPAWRLV